jgi:hypothetical protein
MTSSQLHWSSASKETRIEFLCRLKAGKVIYRMVSVYETLVYQIEGRYCHS